MRVFFKQTHTSVYALTTPLTTHKTYYGTHVTCAAYRYLEMKARANAANLMAEAGVGPDNDADPDGDADSSGSDDEYDGGSIGS